MALYIVTEDRLLADYVLHDCPACVGWLPSLQSLPEDAVCIVDGDTLPPPYPPHTCLLISRRCIEGEIPCLIRPLVPGDVAQALAPSVQSEEVRLLPSGVSAGGCLVRGTASATLPAAEYVLCEALLRTMEGGAPVSREALCKRLASAHAQKPNDMLTVYMYRLRKRLRPLGVTLVTHRDRGYSLQK